VTDRPARYELLVKGVLDDYWSDWFEGFRLRRDQEADTTALVGVVADQAALHGVLVKIRDAGLPLLGVRRLDPD
jgi:hypothetical protein